MRGASYRVGSTWRHTRAGYLVTICASIGDRIYFREEGRDERLALRALEYAAFRVLFRPVAEHDGANARGSHS